MTPSPRSRTWDASCPAHQVRSIQGRKTYVVPESVGQCLGCTEPEARTDYAAKIQRQAGVPGFRSLISQTAECVSVVPRYSTDDRLLRDMKP